MIKIIYIFIFPFLILLCKCYERKKKLQIDYIKYFKTIYIKIVLFIELLKYFLLIFHYMKIFDI